MKRSLCRVLIVGGGIAGLNAAAALHQCGAEVHLVEKNDRLGGHAIQWTCMATDTCQNCGACLVAEQAEKIINTPGINVYLGATAGHIVRDGDQFRTTISWKDQKDIIIDAVIIATGMRWFDPSRIELLGYGRNKKVITTADLNSILREEKLGGVLNGTKNPEIAFIQCVGSRNREMNRDYCSQVCCKTTVRQSQKILHLIPEANVTVFHIDLQIIGKEFRSLVADLKTRVKFLQGVPGRIFHDSKTDRLAVFREDEESGARIAHYFDLIVLAVGMEAPAVDSQMLSQSGLEIDRWGFVHQENRSSGGHVYVAGTAQGPMDILSAGQQGTIIAHQIAKDFGLIPQNEAQKTLTVIGRGREGLETAEYFSDAGFPVTFLRFDKETSAITNEKFRTFPETRLISIAGVNGGYTIRLASDGAETTVDSSIIVVAAEARHLENAGAAAIGTGDGCLVSLRRLQEKWASRDMAIPVRAAFWLDHKGPEWKTNARQALVLASDMVRNGCRADIILENMPVYGLEGQDLYDRARREGVRILRPSDSSAVVVSRDNGTLMVRLTDHTLPDTELKLDYDLLVMPEQVVPATENVGLARILKQPLDREGFMQPANIRHRPVTASRKGIYFAGSSHDENDLTEFMSELHSICCDINSQVINRSKEGLHPVINEGQCVRCLTCYRTCPHEAIVIRNGRQPFISPDACFGCGRCVSLCPAQAISCSSDRTEKADEWQKGTYIFACERSAAIAGEQTGYHAGVNPGNIFIERIPCACGLSTRQILSPILNGADRVLVAACHPGNCRSVEQGAFAASRADRLLAEIGLNDSGVSYHAVSANEPFKFKRIVLDLTGQV